MRSAFLMGCPMKYSLISHCIIVQSIAETVMQALVTHWGSDFRPCLSLWFETGNFLIPLISQFLTQKDTSTPFSASKPFRCIFPSVSSLSVPEFLTWHYRFCLNALSSGDQIFWLLYKVQEYHLLTFKLKLVILSPALPWGTMRTMTFPSGLVWESTSPATWVI